MTKPLDRPCTKCGKCPPEVSFYTRTDNSKKNSKSMDYRPMRVPV